MAVTPINSEDRLVQKTFADHLERVLGWETVYAFNDEAFGPSGTLGRADATDAVLTRDLRAALARLNPTLPASAIDDALRQLTAWDVSRSMVQHNRDLYRLLRGGVPVEYRDATGQRRSARARGDRLRQCAWRQPIPGRTRAEADGSAHPWLQPPRGHRVLRERVAARLYRA